MKKLYLLCCVVGAVLSSCVEQEFESAKSDSNVDESRIIEPEEAFPSRDKEAITLKSGITVYKVDSLYIFEGDIILTEEQVEMLDSAPTRSAVLNNFAKYWPEGKVYYSYASGFSNVANVEAAIDEWELKTCIRFYPRTNQSDYILFKDSDDTNSSPIGRSGGQQTILLARTKSDIGSAIHEIGHSIGLFHEQTRADRDDYVTILWNKIKSDKKHNFDKYTVNYAGYDIGPFDFNSVMLYHSWSFSIDDSATMTKKDGSTFYAQRSYLSTGDVNGVRLIYGPPYVRIVEDVISDDVDWYGNRWRDWYSNLVFFADKECTQRVTLDSPRVVYICYSYFYQDRTSPPNTSRSYSTVFVPAGVSEYGLGLCREVAEYDYGNIVHNSSENYSIAFK